MSPVGMYHPGRSLIHRCPPGPKLVALAAVLAAALRWPAPVALVTVVGYAVARVPVRTALAGLRPLLPLLVITALFHVVATGPARAAEVTLVLVVTVAAAHLVTLTTPVSAMLDAVTRGLGPLRRFGVDPDRVGLLLALTIRAVPLLADIVGEVRQAQLARGSGRGLYTLVVPVVVRMLRTAHALGEALAARGVDD